MTEKRKQTDEAIEQVRISDIQSGPVRHANPPAWFIDKAREVHEIVRDVFDLPFEEFLQNFQRELDPSRELGIWLWIATRYKEIAASPLVPASKKKDVFEVILGITILGAEQVLKETAGNLSQNEVRSIIEFCFRNSKESSSDTS